MITVGIQGYFYNYSFRTNVTDHRSHSLCIEILPSASRVKLSGRLHHSCLTGFSLCLCNWMYWSYWRELHCRVPRGILLEKIESWKLFIFLLTSAWGWWLQAFRLVSIQPDKSSEKIKINKKSLATTFLINQCSKTDSSHFVYLLGQTFFRNISTSCQRNRNYVGFSTKKQKCNFLWLKKD